MLAQTPPAVHRRLPVRPRRRGNTTDATGQRRPRRSFALVVVACWGRLLEFDLGHAAIELFERLLDLRASSRVRGRRELPFELGAGEPQRLEGAYLLGVADVAPPCLRALAFELFHPFLNSRVRVDQAFAGITHSHPH